MTGMRPRRASSELREEICLIATPRITSTERSTLIAFSRVSKDPSRSTASSCSLYGRSKADQGVRFGGLPFFVLKRKDRPGQGAVTHPGRPRPARDDPVMKSGDSSATIQNASRRPKGPRLREHYQVDRTGARGVEAGGADVTRIHLGGVSEVEICFRACLATACRGLTSSFIQT